MTYPNKSSRSMARGFIFTALIAVATISSQTAFANFPFSKAESPGDPGIGTLTMITPGNVSITGVYLTLKIGFSKTSPCSDLAVRYDHRSVLDPIVSRTFPLTSDAFVKDEIYRGETPGSETCEEIDFEYKGKTYSTGSYQLVWDVKQQQYIKMIPSSIVVDFTK